MSVLVTGATGALGRHVVARLQHRHDLCLLVDPTDVEGELWARRQDAEVRLSDIRDRERVAAAIRGHQSVVHLAGVAGVRASDAVAMRSVNTDGVQAVGEACVHTGARLVHLSSASAVGLSPDPTPMTENHRFEASRVTHAYPLSKRAGQHLVQQLVRAGRLDAVILNPGAVLAPGDSRANAWSALPAAMRRGLRWAPPGGFGFVGRATFLDAVEAALSGPASPSLNLIIDESASYHELFTRISDAIGSRRIRVVNATGVRAGLNLAGILRRLPGLSTRLPADRRLIPLVCWPNAYDGSAARARFGLSRPSLDDVVTDLLSPDTEGAPHA